MKDEDDEKIELGEPDKLDFLKRAPRPYTCPVCKGNGLVPQMTDIINAMEIL